MLIIYSVFPIITAPGYKIQLVLSPSSLGAYTDCRAVLTINLGRSIDERTVVHFADNPERKLKAYVDSGEGLDRAGGFAIQVSLLPHRNTSRFN